MKKIMEKRHTIGIVLAIFIFTTFCVAANDKRFSGSIQLNNEDRVTAEQISNMTGVKVEDIAKLKSESKDWNEVLSKLRSKNYKVSKEELENRKTILAGNGQASDFVTNLKSLGYSNDDIINAKMLVERVESQLSEIAQFNEENINTAKAISETDSTEEDLTQFVELSGKYKINDGTAFILKLNKDFSTPESVLDEYLLSLQLGLDLNLYISDKKEYEKQKADKGSLIDGNRIITVAKIEEKALSLIQKRNKLNDNLDTSNKQVIDKTNPNSNVSTNVEVPLPKTEVKKPNSSANDVTNEINNINNNIFNPKIP